jgi:hypothetical protein
MSYALRNQNRLRQNFFMLYKTVSMCILRSAFQLTAPFLVNVRQRDYCVKSVSTQLNIAILCVFMFSSLLAGAQGSKNAEFLRDPLKQPFTSTSIWNKAIGASATYVHANLPLVPGKDVWAPMPQVDEEIIVLRPAAPVTAVYYNDAGWTGKNRCIPSGAVIAQVPIPNEFYVPNSRKNNAAAFLLSDGRTIIHTQPFTKCVGNSPTSLVKFESVDLFGDGRAGSHGGSGLSGIGGSLRIGELRPNGNPPRHALKVNVYAKEALYRCVTKSECATWPAFNADSYAVGHYGTIGTMAPLEMKMGALLAIPTSFDLETIRLETQPARMLAWTLQNYGAYIVDDTSGPGFAINAENGPDGSFQAQFEYDWGFRMEQRVRDDTPWVRDIQRILQTLHVVTNNSAQSIGGPGIPLQPLAPELRNKTR